MRKLLKFIVDKFGDDMMTKIGQVYLCEICGNKVEVLESGEGTLVCCGKPMKLMKKGK